MLADRRNRRIGWTWLVWWIFVLAGPATVAVAGEKRPLHIERDAQVVYCAAEWPSGVRRVRQTLNAGIAMTVAWQLSISRARQYWLDEAVAELEVVRRVTPDLLSHRWILEDQATGIVRTVAELDEAVRFLTRLRRFPVVDRSLLDSGRTYTLRVSLQAFDGPQMAGWWRRMLRSDDFSASLSFREP